jgi:hypothetical protein
MSGWLTPVSEKADEGREDRRLRAGRRGRSRGPTARARCALRGQGHGAEAGATGKHVDAVVHGGQPSVYLGLGGHLPGLNEADSAVGRIEAGRRSRAFGGHEPAVETADGDVKNRRSVSTSTAGCSSAG